MSVDSIRDYKSPVTEVSKPVEKWSTLKVKIQQIFNKRDDQSPQKTLKELSSLEITRESQEISPTTITQPKKLTDTTSQDQVEVDKIREDIRNIPTTQEESPKSTDSDSQISTVDRDSKKSHLSIIGKIEDIYSKKQQEKVEKYKELILSDFNYSKPDEDRLRKEKPPSIVKQFGRIVLDTRAAKIIFPRLHENSHFQQELEAENTAAVEYYGERNFSIKAEHQAEEVRIEQEKIAEAQRKVKEAQLEQQKFEQDFIQEMENYRGEKVTKRKKERVQEITEKLFNERLTKLEDIDLDSSIDGSGVIKKQLEDVVFYDMEGYQFCFLQHAINYKYSVAEQNPELIGSQTAKELIYNPSFWEKSRDNIGKTGGQETDSKSNIIATSYINTETNLTDWGQYLIYYGFDEVLPGTLIESTGGDGGTSTHIEEGLIKLTTDLNFLGTPENIEKSDSYYNEIDLKRYDSNGKPKLPRFLIVKDWDYQTSETKEIFLKHARNFNIPIINIETKFYKIKHKGLG